MLSEPKTVNNNSKNKFSHNFLKSWQITGLTYSQVADNRILKILLNSLKKFYKKVTEDDGFLAGAKVQKSSYPSMTKSFTNFKLNVNSGVYSSSEITVLMGPNGAGKSTFIKLLAGRETPDIQCICYLQFAF